MFYDIKNLPNRLSRIYSKAYECALTSDMSFRHGSVLFNGNKIYNYGCNNMEKVFCGYHGFPSIHAEMSSLKFVAKHIHRFEGA